MEATLLSVLLQANVSDAVVMGTATVKTPYCDNDLYTDIILGRRRL